MYTSFVLHAGGRRAVMRERVLIAPLLLIRKWTLLDTLAVDDMLRRPSRSSPPI